MCYDIKQSPDMRMHDMTGNPGITAKERKLYSKKNRKARILCVF